MQDIPDPVIDAFRNRSTLNQKEVAALLDIDEMTFRQHIRAGNIGYVSFGMGKLRETRRFTFAHVVEFIRSRSKRNYPGVRRSIRSDFRSFKERLNDRPAPKRK